MSLTSYGKSFLGYTSSRRASFRRTLRTFLAARERWPSGFLRIYLDGSAEWRVGKMVAVACEVI